MVHCTGRGLQQKCLVLQITYALDWQFGSPGHKREKRANAGTDKENTSHPKSLVIEAGLLVSTALLIYIL